MALFQNSVGKKYLTAQDNLPIKKAFEAYRAYFHNPKIHGNIQASKEEQFQEGFLRELFVYNINPNPDYILPTELKNIKETKKAELKIAHLPRDIDELFELTEKEIRILKRGEG